MDGPGPMRPGFPPRFDGPPGHGPGPEFFNRMPFDDHPRHRHPRHDERRRFPRDDNIPSDNAGPTPEKPDRKSRWSSGSPVRSEPMKENEKDNEDKDQKENETNTNSENISEIKMDHKEIDNSEPLPPGSTTPIRDEFENCKPPAQMLSEPEPEFREEIREEPKQEEAPMVCEEPEVNQAEEKVEEAA